MKITRESIVESIKLSKDVLPKFTAFEMARVIGVPVKYLLKAIQANHKNFKFDAEKNIISLDNTSRVQNINSNEVWGWYLKNKLEGNDKGCLMVSDQQRLMASLNARVKWDCSFGLVTATFATLELSGTDVKNRVVKDYDADIAGRLIKLGTIGGAGQVPDRYVFGVILAEAEIAARQLGSFPLYSTDWAMEMMMDAVDWIDIEVPDIYEVTSLPFSNNGQPATPPSLGSPAQTAGVTTDTKQILTGVGSSKPPISGTVQRGRRTKEQIDADLKKMVDELNSRSMFTPEQIETVTGAKNITDAEKAYKALIAESDAVIAKENASKGQQSLFKEGGVPINGPTAQPQEPVVVFKPAEPTTSHQHVPPPLHSAPATLPSTRVSMPKLEDLEKVSDIKAAIRSDAGMPVPPSVSTNPVVPPVVAQSSVQQAPPVSNPPPAGASASAEDLLNGLLKATGQLAG
jgi:hypothetical protein